VDNCIAADGIDPRQLHANLLQANAALDSSKKPVLVASQQLTRLAQPEEPEPVEPATPAEEEPSTPEEAEPSAGEKKKGKGGRKGPKGGEKSPEAEEEAGSETGRESEEEEDEPMMEGAFGGEEHGHGHGPPLNEEEARIRIALSLTMISMVAVTMGLFYLTNWPDPDIRRATWSVVASTLTIFCAIVAFNALKELSMGLLHDPEDFFQHETGEEPKLSVLVHHIVRAATLMVGLYITLWLIRKRPKSLEVVAGIGAHIVGFALIEAFGTLQLRTPFLFNPMMSFVVVLLASTIILAVVGIGTSMRQSTLVSPDDEPLKEAFEEAENDYTGLALGLLVCQTIKFMIVGHIAPIHGAPKGKTIWEVLMLAAAAAFMALVVIGVSAANSFVINDETSEAHTRIRRCCNIAERGASMALGWNMLYAGQWAFWTLIGGAGVAGGDDMIAGMLMLVAFGIVGFGLIFLVDALAQADIIQRPAMEALINGVGLSLALTWEITVDTSIQCMHTVIPHHGVRFIDAAVDVFLCAIVIPALVLYILPRAKESHNYYSEMDSQHHSHNAHHHKEFHNVDNWRTESKKAIRG